MILAHVLFHLAAAKANKLRNKRQNDTDQRGKTEPPVNGQQDDDHDDGGCDRRHKIRELMGNKPFHALDILIHDFTQAPAADGQMIAQRNFGDMVSEQDLQLVQCTERRHVGTENSQKIQQDISHNPGERQPAIIHDHSHIQLVKVRKNTDN